MIRLGKRRLGFVDDGKLCCSAWPPNLSSVATILTEGFQMASPRTFADAFRAGTTWVLNWKLIRNTCSWVPNRGEPFNACLWRLRNRSFTIAAILSIVSVMRPSGGALQKYAVPYRWCRPLQPFYLSGSVLREQSVATSHRGIGCLPECC